VLPLDLVLVLTSLAFAAAILNGIAGFGFALVMVTMLALLIDARSGVIVMSLVTTPLSVMQLYRHRQHRGVLRRIAPFLTACVVGVGIGTLLLVAVPEHVLRVSLGLFTLVYVVITALGVELRIPVRAERVAAPPVGLATGMVTGTLGVSGPLLGTYLLALGLTPLRVIFGMSAAFVFMGIARAMILFGLHAYTAETVALGITLLAPAAIGQLVGFRAQERLSTASIHRLLLLILALASLQLLLGHG
jgi:uncharacterized membrane protein YfcA